MARRKDRIIDDCKVRTEATGWNGSRNRREFFADSAMQITVLASSSALLALIGGCGGGNSSTPTSPPSTDGGGGGGGGSQVQIDISQSPYTALAAVGGAVALNASALAGLPANGVFIIRTSASSIVVLSRTCTHMGCQVGAFNGGIAECPCHGSRYDTNGNVVRGPAPRSLTRYTATLNGNIITLNI
ncbi:MAG: Rieske (2Fe-2S) protein [Candidatus Glassbacteria bacterium]